MATYSSILAWRIPWTEEHGGLQSKELQRVGHDLSTKQQQNQLTLHPWIPGTWKALRRARRHLIWASLVAQAVNNPSAIWETWVRSLGWEGSLEKEVATYSSILAWRIPWTVEPGRLQSMGLQRIRHN